MKSKLFFYLAICLGLCKAATDEYSSTVELIEGESSTDFEGNDTSKDEAEALVKQLKDPKMTTNVEAACTKITTWLKKTRERRMEKINAQMGCLELIDEKNQCPKTPVERTPITKKGDVDEEINKLENFFENWKQTDASRFQYGRSYNDVARAFGLEINPDSATDYSETETEGQLNLYISERQEAERVAADVLSTVSGKAKEIMNVIQLQTWAQNEPIKSQDVQAGIQKLVGTLTSAPELPGQGSTSTLSDFFYNGLYLWPTTPYGLLESAWGIFYGGIKTAFKDLDGGQKPEKSTSVSGTKVPIQKLYDEIKEWEFYLRSEYMLRLVSILEKETMVAMHYEAEVTSYCFASTVEHSRRMQHGIRPRFDMMKYLAKEILELPDYDFTHHFGRSREWRVKKLLSGLVRRVELLLDIMYKQLTRDHFRRVFAAKSAFGNVVALEETMSDEIRSEIVSGQAWKGLLRLMEKREGRLRLEKVYLELWNGLLESHENYPLLENDQLDQSKKALVEDGYRKSNEKLDPLSESMMVLSEVNSLLVVLWKNWKQGIKDVLENCPETPMESKHQFFTDVFNHGNSKPKLEDVLRLKQKEIEAADPEIAQHIQKNPLVNIGTIRIVVPDVKVLDTIKYDDSYGETVNVYESLNDILKKYQEFLEGSTVTVESLQNKIEYQLSLLSSVANYQKCPLKETFIPFFLRLIGRLGAGVDKKEENGDKRLSQIKNSKRILAEFLQFYQISNAEVVKGMLQSLTSLENFEVTLSGVEQTAAVTKSQMEDNNIMADKIGETARKDLDHAIELSNSLFAGSFNGDNAFYKLDRALVNWNEVVVPKIFHALLVLMQYWLRILTGNKTQVTWKEKEHAITQWDSIRRHRKRLESIGTHVDERDMSMFVAVHDAVRNLLENDQALLYRFDNLDANSSFSPSQNNHKASSAGGVVAGSIAAVLAAVAATLDLVVPERVTPQALEVALHGDSAGGNSSYGNVGGDVSDQPQDVLAASSSPTREDTVKSSDNAWMGVSPFGATPENTPSATTHDEAPSLLATKGSGHGNNRIHSYSTQHGAATLRSRGSKQDDEEECSKQALYITLIVMGCILVIGGVSVVVYIQCLKHQHKDGFGDGGQALTDVNFQNYDATIKFKTPDPLETAAVEPKYGEYGKKKNLTVAGVSTAVVGTLAGGGGSTTVSGDYSSSGKRSVNDITNSSNKGSVTQIEESNVGANTGYQQGSMEYVEQFYGGPSYRPGQSYDQAESYGANGSSSRPGSSYVQESSMIDMTHSSEIDSRRSGAIDSRATGAFNSDKPSGMPYSTMPSSVRGMQSSFLPSSMQYTNMPGSLPSNGNLDSSMGSKMSGSGERNNSMRSFHAKKKNVTHSDTIDADSVSEPGSSRSTYFVSGARDGEDDEPAYDKKAHDALSREFKSEFIREMDEDEE